MKYTSLSLHVFLRALLDQNLFDDDSFLYEEAPELLRFRTAAPSIELLTDWYQSRAKDIDSCSRQVRTLVSSQVPGCGKKNKTKKKQGLYFCRIKTPDS